jgi:hypothetical protein
MSGIVDSLKSVKEVDAQIAEVDSLISKHAAGMVTVGADHRNAVEEWRERGRDAFAAAESFAEPPPVEPPTLALAQEFLNTQRHKREVLMRERDKRVAAGAEEVMAAAQKIVTKALSKAAPLLEQLDGIVAEVRRAQAELMQVRDAKTRVSVNGVRGVQPAPPIDLAGLAHAVAHGLDPLAGHEVTEQSRLGLTSYEETPQPDPGAPAYAGPPESPADRAQRERDDRKSGEWRTREAALGVQRAQLTGEKPLGYRPANL